MTTIAGTCVEWPHYRNPKGYGQTKIGGRKGRAWLARHLNRIKTCRLA